MTIPPPPPQNNGPDFGGAIGTTIQNSGQRFDTQIKAFHAPVQDAAIPYLERFRERLIDFTGAENGDTICTPATSIAFARSVDAVVGCMNSHWAPDGFDDDPDSPGFQGAWLGADPTTLSFDYVKSWTALNRPGVLVSADACEIGRDFWDVYGCSFHTIDPGPEFWPEDPALADRVRLLDPRGMWQRLDFGPLPPDIAVEEARAAAIPSSPPETFDMTTPRNRWAILRAADLEALPSMAELIKGVLPPEGVAMFYGASMSAKTFLTLNLLDALSRGLPEWFGHKVTGAVPCTYIGLEGVGGIPKRFKVLGPHKINVILPDGFDLRNATDRRDMVELIKGAGAVGGLLVIDTLQQACPGMDENGKDMPEALDGLKEMQRALGGLVVALHHPGKDSSKGPRGHSSQIPALDVVLEVTRNGDNRGWRLIKSKDGEDGTEHAFKLRVVQVGTDTDGEAVTSCVVEPDGMPTLPRKAPPPKAGNQRVILDALKELLSRPEAAFTTGAPEGRPAIEFEKAVEATRTHLTVEPARQSERARLAFTGLINGGWVVHRNGLLWLP